MGHDTRFTWPRRCDAHRLLPATRDSTPARPFAMLTGEPLRPWQVCDVTRTTFSSIGERRKHFKLTGNTQPHQVLLRVGGPRATAVRDRSPSGASRWPAQPAPHCLARVSNPFSLTKRSCLPSLDVPQWLIDDFFDGPTIGRPL